MAMEQKVCVTGATGFIASWVIKLLLERGYTVHATLRSLKDPGKTDHLFSLDGAKERLHLFEANLIEEGSFDSAIQGCHGVFHIATPVNLNSSNPQVEIIDTAVKGTLNVLNSCTKVTSIKRVVLTSSVAAVTFGRPITHESVVDETWFSTVEGGKEVPGNVKWYILSKTLAEEAAWKFAKDKGIDIVLIHPSIVLGPFFTPSLHYGACLMLDLINEPEKYHDLAAACAFEGWVHVKDVAQAHILAFEIPSANGRYILSESVASFPQVVTILQDLYPTLDFSNKCVEKVGVTYKFSKERATTLGINYIPLRDAIKETVECLKDNNFINV